MGKFFGTDGIRGVVNETLTPEFVLKMAQAIGSYFGEGSKVVIGRDSRAGGDMIKSIVIGGLLSAGVKVYDAGYTPTPALQYCVKKEGFDGGVMITASHNPPEYNGIKVIGPDGVEIPREHEDEIEDIYLNSKFRVSSWRSVVNDVVEFKVCNDIYVEGVVKLVDSYLIAKAGFKIVVDPVNSVGALTTPKIAMKLGVKAVVVNGTLDPLFPARSPEPTPETLVETVKLVKDYGAVAGFAHDADADRVIVVDENGVVQWGDRTATLLAYYLKKERGEKGSKVFTAVSSSTVIEDVLKPLGVSVVWLKVGSVDIAHEMKKHQDVLCGFEENGGFMYPPHQYVRDGGMTMALFLEMLARLRAKPSELYGMLPKVYVLKKKYGMDRETALKVVERVKEEFKNERQITVDGVKVISRGYWVLVRPSGTEPLLRVMLEAESESKAREIVERIEKIIGEVAGARA
ncbi:phosphoglucosamine mutase [Thermogladius sp. KZ2Tp1]|uniref:phosphoglucosamine mutase n=1 Tax=Thermogladius sp. KZ2Tp1 TaxID=3136289 RepID=UPI003DA86D2A